MSAVQTITPTLARRLFISKQKLAGPRPQAHPEGMLDLIRDLGCLQLDPTNAVARTHLLVLWSRLGTYDTANLDKLLWQDRSLFEYWAHAASIVLTEDYPIHRMMMRAYGESNSAWRQWVRDWMRENQELHDHILVELRERGPLLSKDFEDKAVRPWASSGWTGGRNVGRMLDFLWSMGRVMVAGRKGGQKLWDLAERCLPEWTPREELSDEEVVYRAAQKSLRALGVGRNSDITQHYTRGRYPGLNKTLARLESEDRIRRVQIEESGTVWPGTWYVHSEDVPLLDRLTAGEWEPRTTLLSPFDNLICDRARTEAMFNFWFRIEIYVPKANRQYGYFVLPILHGDRLIGRIDPLMDRKQQRLNVNAIYAEPDAPMSSEVAQSVRGAIEGLGTFLGAKEIVYGEKLPEEWRGAFV